MNELTLVQKVVVWVLPVLFAITVHETAHGWMAKQLGDRTALMLGRLTLNPLKHIDPVGTIAVPLVLFLLNTGFLFGWAKPVPVTWDNLRNPRRDMALVALAGPVSNLLMAIFWALIILAVVSVGSVNAVTSFAVYVGVAGITINCSLMVLNMLPLPPLDGGRVLVGILPGKWAYKVSRIEPYGFVILMALLALGWLGALMWPMIYFCISALCNLAGMPTGVYVSVISRLM